MTTIERLESRRLYSVTVSPTSFTAPEKVARTHVFATFTTTDPAPHRPGHYVATIDFGDGSHARGRIGLAGSIFSVTATHNYKKLGFFSYTVVVKDHVDKSTARGTGGAVITSRSGTPYTNLTVDESAIFSHAYGGTFVESGKNYTNGSVTAERVPDNQDEIWSGGILSARAVAAESSDVGIFGYFAGTTNTTFIPLFTATGVNLNVGGACGAVAITGPFRLGRSGSGNTFSSNPVENEDGRDHLITYLVAGVRGQLPSQRTYLLLWEDTVSTRSDFDFNDLVVELKTSAT